MKTYKLMIKQHNITGYKYLCYTQKSGKDYDKYLGSGIMWSRHLKIHGNDISTNLIFDTDDYEEFKAIAITKSVEFNIVESDDWANLKIEEGDGGSTTHNKRWITDGIIDIYINLNEDLPESWRYGRSNCVFNDSLKQKEFNAKIDTKARGIAIKSAWDNGKFDKRDNSKCGVSGELNPSKRSDVKEKQRKAALAKSKETYKEMGRLSGLSRQGKVRGKYRKSSS